MVVVLEPAADKIYKSFTHNLLTRAQGNPTLLSITIIHKECIPNISKLESNFGGGQHGFACISIGNQQYALYYQIVFVPPKKTGISPAYTTNPMPGNIAVVD